MFCPNCGTDCREAKFCPECGTNLREWNGAEALEKPLNTPENYPPLTEPYVVEIDGKSIDLHKVIKTYGTGVRKIGAYSYLVSEFGMPMQRAKEILDPIYEAHKGEKISFKDSFSAQVQLEADKQKQALNEHDERKAELDKQGVAYCPKCLSTSITGDKKGFGIGKAVVGASLVGGLGLMAGNIHAKKVRLTCMKCGHQWMAGKK